MAKSKKKPAAKKVAGKSQPKKAPPKKVAAKKPSGAPAPGTPLAAGTPTDDEIAAFLGVSFVAAPDTSTVRHQRKALPGYAAVLKDASDKLGRETVDLGLPDVTPRALDAVRLERSRVLPVEQALDRWHGSVYHQRLTLDDRGMGLLRALVRRVKLLGETNQNLLERYSDEIAFVHQFAPSGHPSSDAGAAPPRATDGMECPAHPGESITGTCERCGNFVCKADARALDGKTFCAECAARSDVDYLESFRQELWGKRDGFAFLYGVLGTILNALMVVFVGTILVRGAIYPPAGMLLLAIVATGLGVDVGYLLGKPWLAPA